MKYGKIVTVRIFTVFMKEWRNFLCGEIFMAMQPATWKVKVRTG